MRGIFSIYGGILFIIRRVDVLVIFFSIGFCLFSVLCLFFRCGFDVVFGISILGELCGIFISCFGSIVFLFFLGTGLFLFFCLFFA